MSYSGLASALRGTSTRTLMQPSHVFRATPQVIYSQLILCGAHESRTDRYPCRERLERRQEHALEGSSAIRTSPWKAHTGCRTSLRCNSTHHHVFVFPREAVIVLHTSQEPRKAPRRKLEGRFQNSKRGAHVQTPPIDTSTWYTRGFVRPLCVRLCLLWLRAALSRARHGSLHSVPG